MNAILFAIAFGGVLAAAAAPEPVVSADGFDRAMDYSAVEIAQRDMPEEPFMARGELRDPELGDWSISVIGGID